MTTLVGAPDGQRPVVATQMVLAALSAADTSQSVDLPQNCESLSIIMPTASFGGTVSVVGDMTGVSYPIGSVSTLATSDFYEVSPVFPIVDSSVTVTLSEATTTDWWIISDSAPRFQFGTVSSGIPLAKGSVRNVFSNFVSSSTSLTVAVSWEAGDTVIAVLTGYNTGINSVSSPGLTFTALTPFGNGSGFVYVYYANPTAAGSGTITFTLNNDWMMVTVFDVAGSLAFISDNGASILSLPSGATLTNSFYVSNAASVTVCATTGFNTQAANLEMIDIYSYEPSWGRKREFSSGTGQISNVLGIARWPSGGPGADVTFATTNKGSLAVSDVPLYVAGFG